MKLTESQKILLFNLLVESLKLDDRGLFSLNTKDRVKLANKILKQQDDDSTGVVCVPCENTER